MTPGSKVRIVKLVLDPRSIAGSGHPQVGDWGIVLSVEHDDNDAGKCMRFVVESMGRGHSSLPDWTGEFAAEELELLPP